MKISNKWRASVRVILTTISVMAVFAFLGCGKRAGDSKSGSKQSATKHDGHDHAHDGHDHAAEGPHHGQLIDLGGEEYHAELIHDDAAGKVTIYLLDSKAKAGVPIAASEIKINLLVGEKPTQYALRAAPDASDPGGKSSRFELADKTLSDAMDAEGSNPRVSVEIEGKPYIGVIDHHEHDGHEH